jgi:sugar/nucleoside kinase (ribokinase family)
VVLVDPDGERTFLPDRGAAGELHDVDPRELDGVAVLHVPAYGLLGGRTAASVHALLRPAADRGRARQPRRLVVGGAAGVRPEAYRELVLRVRPVALFANADEARELDLLRRPLRACGSCSRTARGRRPCVEADGHAPAVPVDPSTGVRDSTGAGDAFAAGLAVREDGGPRRARARRARPRAGPTGADLARGRRRPTRTAGAA